MHELQRYFLYGTLFITGGVILVIEIAGSRVVAPFYGSSIFVWSSLITVTLASLAIGYALGGALADRKPQYTVLYVPIFIAGLFTILIPKLAPWALTVTRGLGITYGPLLSAALLFTLPLLLLAMMTPAAIRIQSTIVQQVGATAGRLYAVSTVGSLVGALVVGFVLIPFIGVSRIMTGSGVVLIVTALLWVLSLRHMRAALVMAVVSITFFLIPDAPLSAASDATLLYKTPSFYGEIRVVEKGAQRLLLVDGVSQTIVSTGPSPLSFYTKTMRIAELLSRDPER
ncbi:MAG: fused MFS/spermidine synthase, partial [Patescibacteria group bacterium]